ncbi:MAG TPA: redox-regulated ATPase YchF [Acidobacteriota bacterium]|nr:redox-regulated ATPase YchF [Acidobacteriota bacterium]
MKLAIIGLPQVGKKTVFKILTGIAAEKAPTKDGVAHAVALVRDPRVDRLSEMFQPRKTRYAEFDIVLPPDIEPEQTRTANWLEAIRKADGLLHVIRAFSSPSVFHISGSVDPRRDLELVEMELLLADLDLVEKRLQRMAKEHQKSNVAQERERQVLERAKAHLESEKPLRTMGLGEDELSAIRSLNFLTLKPLVAALNVDDDYSAAQAKHQDLACLMESNGSTVVFLSAALESEISELPPEEQAPFLEELKIEEPTAHRLSRAAFRSLGLLSFFTVGPDEVRAWPVEAGALAPEAAGRIHSDMQKGFIRAEVITYDELIKAGSEKAAHDANLYRLKGKDYEVQDGDVLHIRFNV